MSRERGPVVGGNKLSNESREVCLRIIREVGPEGIEARDLAARMRSCGFRRSPRVCFHSDDLVYEEGEGNKIRYFWCGK